MIWLPNANRWQWQWLDY